MAGPKLDRPVEAEGRLLMKPEQKATSGGGWCFLAVPATDSWNWGQCYGQSLPSLFLLFFLKKKKKISNKQPISHDLEKWPESRVWLQNVLWPFPAKDVKPPVTRALCS